MTPYAIFSCDLDTVDRHLQGYGIEDLPACDRIYRTAVPRLLELFAELGVPGVLFVIARDAASERALWRQAVAAGHEIASHSLTHTQPFSTLDDDRLRSNVPGKDRPRLCIDVDVGLNEIRKVAPPPPDAAPSHVE